MKTEPQDAGSKTLARTSIGKVPRCAKRSLCLRTSSSVQRPVGSRRTAVSAATRSRLASTFWRGAAVAGEKVAARRHTTATAMLRNTDELRSPPGAGNLARRGIRRVNSPYKCRVHAARTRPLARAGRPRDQHRLRRRAGTAGGDVDGRACFDAAHCHANEPRQQQRQQYGVAEESQHRNVAEQIDRRNDERGTRGRQQLEASVTVRPDDATAGTPARSGAVNGRTA